GTARFSARSGVVPRTYHDGAVLEVGDLRTFAVLDTCRCSSLRDGAADAQLRAEDLLCPDDGLVVAARACVRQATQRADDDDVVVGKYPGACVAVAGANTRAVRLVAPATPDGAGDYHRLATRLHHRGGRPHVGHAPACRLDLG